MNLRSLIGRTGSRQYGFFPATVREVVDLYGKTGKFDVIAITDHILMKKDLLARAGRLATLGRRSFGLREGDFAAYLADIRTETKRAFERYGMLVIPGAEITQNRIRGHKNSHVIGLSSLFPRSI